jgi:hypothetical protein
VSQYFKDLTKTGVLSLIKAFISALLMLLVAEAYALNEARLLNLSKSGQTVLFNLGIHDGVREGDYAVIVKEIRDLDTRDLRIVPVAKARNIKINPDSSVWIIYKAYDAELLVVGQEFLILSETEMLRGRRDPRLGRITVVGPKNKRKETLMNVMTDDRDRLGKLKDKYAKSEITHEQTPLYDDEGTLIDMEDWTSVKGTKYRTAFLKSPNAREYQRQLRLATFEKLVTGYLRKVNDPDFSYDKFYDEQMKSEYNGIFRKNSNFETEYKDFLLLQSQKVSDEAKLFRKILEKGGSWSEDYSDEELHDTLTNVSVLQEIDRREYVVSKPHRHNVSFDYGFFLNNSQTKSDTQSGARNSYELGYEFIPFVKHKTLERFTIFGTARYSQNAFETSDSNATTNERSFSVGAKWYPLFAPYTVEAPVVFLGIHVRSGQVAMKSPTYGDRANYTLLSVGGLQAGVRYNLKSGIGLRINGSVETLQLDRYQFDRYGSKLPDRKNLVEARTGIALLYAF